MSTAVESTPIQGQRRPVAREVAVGESAIKDVRPGATKAPNPAYHFEGLGDLESFPAAVNIRDKEGVGTYCVVLTDILSGAEGETYVKGQVQRLSKLVNDYNNEDRELVKATVRRLVELRAIRHATPEEISAGFATVTFDSENTDMSEERSRRLFLETENESLRARLAEATATTDPFKED